MQWGSYGSGPGQFSYPRGVAANASEVIVTDDDNHRIEKFDPNGNFQGAAGSNGTGPGQFGFPYGVALDAAGNVYVADDSNHRVVKLNPGIDVRRRVGRPRLKTGSARLPARPGQRPGGRHLRGGHRQRPHRGVRPKWRLPAHARRLGARPRRADRAAGPRHRPRPAGCSSPTRSSNRIEAVRAGSRRLFRRLDDGRGTQRGLQAGQPASAWTRAGRSTSPIRATNESCACGATAPSCLNSAVRAELGGRPAERCRIGRRGARHGRALRGRSEPQPRARLQPGEGR